MMHVTLRRAGRGAAAVAIVAGVFAGCGTKNEDRKEALAAIRAISTTPRQFRAVETEGDQKVIVNGVIGDDFRYRARVSVDGNPLLEEIVSDDAIAIRVLDQTRLSAAVDTTASVTGNAEADAALREGRWVIDKSGAPPLNSTVKRGGPVGGRDPVNQAVTIATYVEQSIGQSFGVFKYDAESIDYKPSEDPFETTEKMPGISRYDLLRPDVPRVSESGGSGQRVNLPGVAHYRKLSVYVSKGKVIRVAERIQFDERLDDTVDFFVGQLKSANVPEEIRQEFERGVKETKDQRLLAQGMLLTLNGAREALGDDPLRLRSLDVRFTGLGKSNEIVMPSDAVEGKLAAFFPVPTDDDAAPPVPGLGGLLDNSSSTTTSSSVPLGTEPTDSSSTTTSLP